MKKVLVTLFLILFGSTYAYAAGFNIGVSGSLVNIEADGTETEGGEKSSTSVEHVAGVPSIFAEIAINERISFGIDYVPMDADVSGKEHTRVDTEKSVTNTATTANTLRTQKVSADLQDHTTIYADIRLRGPFYVKAGLAQVDLITNDSLETGSKYPNETVNGKVLGFGFKKHEIGTRGIFKAEFTYTDYDDISLKSSVARAGVTTNNKVEADMDTFGVRLALGF